MSSISVQFSPLELSDLFRQLPDDFKIQLFREWATGKTTAAKKPVAALHFEGFENEINLDDYALRPEQFEKLMELFEDAPPASELAEMLR